MLLLEPVTSLYTETTKDDFFFFFFFGKKGYASTHNVEILNFYNHELEHKDNKSVIGNKLKDILDESFVLEFTK